MTVVLELLRGAELEATSRKYGVTAATLGWREAFQGGAAGLKLRATDVVDEERKTLKSAVTNLVMDNEVLRERIRQMEEEKPFLRWRSKHEPDRVALHSKALRSGPCHGGVEPASTYYAQRHRLNHPVESRKRGPERRGPTRC